MSDPALAPTENAMAAPAAADGASGRLQRWFLLLGRIALGGIFLYAVYAKLDYPPGTVLSFDFSQWRLALDIFAISVNGYGVLPAWAVTPVAYTVPALELVLGVLLLSGVGLRWSAAAASALLLFFFGLMLRAWLLGQSIDCGCFGPGDMLSWKTLLRDGLLVALAAGLAVVSFRAARSARS